MNRNKITIILGREESEKKETQSRLKANWLAKCNLNKDISIVYQEKNDCATSKHFSKFFFLFCFVGLLKKHVNQNMPCPLRLVDGTPSVPTFSQHFNADKR